MAYGPFFSWTSRTCSRVRVRACASYMVLPSFPWRASRSVHDGRRPFFFTYPRTARSRVRVRVRVRVCASYVVLPSFPWRASRSVHDGCRPFFPVSTYSPFTGPCTCVCVVHGFAQFSMARVTFRPRRPSAVFSRVHVQPVHGSVYVRVRRTWFCPVFHGARHVPSTTAVGRFFHVSTYSLFTGPCKGPCTCVCLVRGFAQFSMARVPFRPRRASAVFPVSTYSPFTGPCTCVC